MGGIPEPYTELDVCIAILNPARRQPAVFLNPNLPKSAPPLSFRAPPARGRGWFRCFQLWQIKHFLERGIRDDCRDSWHSLTSGIQSESSKLLVEIAPANCVPLGGRPGKREESSLSRLDLRAPRKALGILQGESPC